MFVGVGGYLQDSMKVFQEVEMCPGANAPRGKCAPGQMRPGANAPRGKCAPGQMCPGAPREKCAPGQMCPGGNVPQDTQGQMCPGAPRGKCAPGQMCPRANVARVNVLVRSYTKILHLTSPFSFRHIFEVAFCLDDKPY